jgi:hypothetical protein
VPLEGFTWHGYPRCLLYIKQVPGGLLTSMSHRGLFSFLSRGLVPLEGFTWHGYPRCLLYIKQVPGGLLTSMSHRGLFSFLSQGLAPLEGSPCLARDPVIKCLAVEAAVFCSAGASF